MYTYNICSMYTVFICYNHKLVKSKCIHVWGGEGGGGYMFVEVNLLYSKGFCARYVGTDT